MNTNRSVQALLKVVVSPIALVLALRDLWKEFRHRRADAAAEALGLRQCSEHPIPFRRNSLSI